MQIQVKCSCGAEKCPEWAIVELQGVVEVQPSFQGPLQNLEIGQLCRPSSQETYTFTIGYHELTGTKVTLKKPLVVLKKVKYMEVNQDEDCNNNSNSGKVEMDVVGVIRHKILFKTRPKALISKIIVSIWGPTYAEMADEDVARPYVPLYQAALRDDWETAQEIIRKDPRAALTAWITSKRENVLHITAGTGYNEFLRKLVDLVEDSNLLELPDIHEDTHLWL